MKYTRDELRAKIVAAIEPMPVQPPKLYRDWRHPYPSYFTPISISDKGFWEWLSCTCEELTFIIHDCTSTGWHPVLDPLTSLDDAVRCVRAAGYRWERVSDDYHTSSMHVLTGALDHHYHIYDDGADALALSLALASAMDGDQAEVVDG